MERRNTIVALAVAGAVAVGMVSCATRCVARRAQDEPAAAVNFNHGVLDGIGFHALFIQNDMFQNELPA